MPPRHRGVVGATGGTRTIRILINPKLTMDRVIAMIAHELQHAVEIIRSGAANQDEVMRLYRRIAIGECAKGRSDRCETRSGPGGRETGPRRAP
jgi:hypothetical protein